MNLHILEKITGVKLSQDIAYLYFNRVLVQAAFGLITGFGTLFFYEKFGGELYKVLILFVFLYAAFAILNHLSAILIKKLGMRKLMIFSLLSLAIMFLSRIMWDYSPMISLGLYFVTFSVYKSFYWIPYHVEFAAFTDIKTRGKQTAILYNIGDLFSAVLPFIGGFILSLWGYNVLFILGFIFVVLSIAPLYKINETKEAYTWSLRRLFSEIKDKDNRPMVWSNLGNGMQQAIAATIWPIFVFISVEGDYVKFGSILAVVTVILIIVRGIVGKFLDRFGSDKILKIGNFVYFSGWIFKMFIGSVTGVLVTDVYHRFGNVINKTSFDVARYDQAADNGHYIDEYTVLREFVVSMGASLMALILIPVVIFTSIKIAFLLGAFSTLLMTLINRQLKVE
jgi:MFS family permease